MRASRRFSTRGQLAATYKFALLVALVEIAIERGDDTTESLPLDTRDLAEKFVDLYWRQAPARGCRAAEARPAAWPRRRARDAAVLNRVAAAHEQFQGSLPRLRRDKSAWEPAPARRCGADDRDHAPLEAADRRPRQAPAPCTRTSARETGSELHGEAVHCLRRFRDLIGDMAETASVRFVRRLPRNHALFGEEPDVREFLFGCDRSALTAVRDLLREVEGKPLLLLRGRHPGRACGRPLRSWSRYPLDLGHNFVLADVRCNGGKLDRLAAFEHLKRWCAATRVRTGRRPSRPACCPTTSGARCGSRVGPTRRRRVAAPPSGNEAGTASSASTTLARRPPAVVGPVAQRVIGFARRAPGSIASQ